MAANNHTCRNSDGPVTSYVVLVLQEMNGVSADTGFDLRDLINRHAPDSWVFLNPGLFTICFVSSNDGLLRANALLQDIRILAHKSVDFGDFLFGISEGPIFVDVGSDGKPISHPVGATVNEAFHNLRVL